MHNLPAGQTLLTTAGVVPPDVVAERRLRIHEGRVESSDTLTREDPVPLRDALAAVGKELGLPDTNDLDVLVAVWAELVGGDVAHHARVRSVRDGECTIEVDGPAWATRVRYLVGDLQRHANERCGDGFLTQVRVVVKAPRRTV